MGALNYVLPPNYSNKNQAEDVKELIHEGRWDMDKIKELLTEEIGAHIQKNISLIEESEKWDKPWWMLNATGNFTVASAWEIMRQTKVKQDCYQYIWSKGISFKMSFLIWRIWKQRLPVDEIIARMGIAMVSKCRCCTQPNQETIEHLFINCQTANRISNYFARTAGISGPFVQLKATCTKWWLAKCSTRLQPIYKEIPAFITWKTWRRRNCITHGGKMTIEYAIQEINTNISLLRKVLYPWLLNIPK